MTTVDRNKWDWYKNHKAEGLFEGTNMPHPHKYDKWKQNHNKWNDNKINQRKLEAENKLVNHMLLPSQTS